MPIAQYVTVLVNKTAMSKTPKTCLAHEVPLLEERFGPENVNLVSISKQGRKVSADSETTRLQRVYGQNEDGMTIFDIVYPRGSGAFARAIEHRYTEDDIAWNLVPRKTIKLPDEKDDTGEQVMLDEDPKTKVIAPAAEEPKERAIEKKAALAQLKEWGVTIAAQTGIEKVLDTLKDAASARLEAAGFATSDLEEYDFDTLIGLAKSLDDEAA